MEDSIEKLQRVDAESLPVKIHLESCRRCDKENRDFCPSYWIAGKKYEYLREETLVVVIKDYGLNDNMHKRVARALKDVSITESKVLERIIKDLDSPGSALLNIGQQASEAKVEAEVREGILHIRAIHSWWFDASTGMRANFEGAVKTQ